MCAGSHKGEEQADEWVVHLDGWPAQRLQQTIMPVSTCIVIITPLLGVHQRFEQYTIQVPYSGISTSLPSSASMLLRKSQRFCKAKEFQAIYWQLHQVKYRMLLLGIHLLAMD